MPRCERGRERPARDLADDGALAVEDRARGPRHGALLVHAQRDEPALRAVGARAREHVRARELLVARADPAEARLDRVRVLRDVVAVQRVADLEPQGIARAQAAGHGAGLDQGVPQLHDLAGRADQLDARLARVARARDGARHAGDARLRERERRRRRAGRSPRTAAPAARAPPGPGARACRARRIRRRASRPPGRARSGVPRRCHGCRR